MRKRRYDLSEIDDLGDVHTVGTDRRESAGYPPELDGFELGATEQKCEQGA